MSQNMLNKKKDVLHNLNVDLRARMAAMNNATNLLSVDCSILNQRDIQKVIEPPKYQLKNKIIPIKLLDTRKNISNNKIVLKQKPRKLRPYDPLYSWNRGGRLKELRIRCQARKFLYLWIKKSLGGVTEMKATNFYQRNLLQKYWDIWYDQYWQLRIEPRLLGRAILHRKYIVIRSIMLAWSWWTKLRSLQRVKLEIAVKYNESNLKKCSMNIWLSWIFVRKCKRKLRSLSEDCRCRHLITWFFNLWKSQLLSQRDMNAKMIVAIRHDRIMIICNVWQRWNGIRSDLRRENIGYLKAMSFFKNLVLKKNFEHWTQYHLLYRLKQKEQNKWMDHYQWNLAKRSMKTWREQYFASLTLALANIKMNDIGKKFQMRRIFLAWRCYTKKVNDKKRTDLNANVVYEMMLKRRTWSKIVKYVTFEKMKASKRAQGLLFYNTIILRRYLQKWSEMLEHKDDESRRVELGAARAQYRFDDCILNRAIFIKTFYRFKQYVDHSKNKKERTKFTEMFRREMILRRSMNMWSKYCVRESQKKEVLKLKAEYVKEKVTRVVLKLWISQTIDRVKAKWNLVEFVKHKDVVDKKRLLNTWRSVTYERLRRSNSTEIAQQHYKETMTRSCLQAMKLYRELRVQIRCLNKMAYNHKSRRLVKKCFQALRRYAESKSNERGVVIAKRGWIEYKLKKAVFNCWRTSVEDNKMINKVVENAYQDKRREVLQQKFEQWRRFVGLRQNKKCNSAKIVYAAREQINARILSKTLYTWKQKTLDRISQSNNCIIAEECFRYKLLRKIFYSWKLYLEEQHLKVFKKQQASWFFQKSQLARTWVTWTEMLTDKQREQYYTKFALVHWASSLQEKVFREWRRHTVHKRKQGEDEIEAFAIFQRRVKRYTIRQWLSSADFLYQWRESQTNAPCHTSTFLFRAFTHWQQWTINRRFKPLTMHAAGLGGAKSTPRPQPTISKSCLEPPIGIIRPKIKFIGQEVQKRAKVRIAAKIPDFLLKSLDGRTLPGSGVTDTTYTFTSNSHHNATSSLYIQDDVLLPPATFFKANTQINGNQCKSITQKSRILELNCIKARLLTFKENKESLRQLQEEVREYDRVLNKLTVDTDNSFYQEFNPLSYREELVRHIKEMEKVLKDELSECHKLTRRARDIVNDID